MDKIKVVDGSEFNSDWDGLYITLEDYENISCARYDSELKKLFKSKSFSFDEDKHEVWDIA